MSEKEIKGLIDEATKLRYSRRQVLKRGTALGLSAAAVTAAMKTSAYAAPGSVRKFAKAPAQLEGTKLSFLGNTYYVKAGQERFEEMASTWGEENGVDVSVDFVSFADVQARIGAAVQAGSGPDIIQMWDPWPYLYQESLVDITDMANAIGDASGGFYDWAIKTAGVGDQWYSIPYGTSSSAYAYRESYFKEAGAETFPETWEDLFAVGKNLKEMGKPIGQALGHSIGDPPSMTYSYMWAYGAMEVEEDGTTVAFNKPEFIDGMGVFIQGWKDAFDETGLSWDDSANNNAFLTDQISATLNGSSIYITAGLPEDDGGVPEIHADMNHGGYPAGPAGKFNNLGAQSYGIMNYSDNIEGAKSFLEYFYDVDNLTSWFNANGGYYIPSMPDYSSLEVYTADPKLAAYLDVVNYGRNKGYAGPSNEKAARAYSTYIVIDTFARAAQEGDAQAAVEWGAEQLERIYNE